MPISVRLDDSTRHLLRRLAHRKACTQSEIIREAITVLARQEHVAEQATRPYELVEDLIGCVSGGPDDLSEATGRRFRDLLVAEGE